MSATINQTQPDAVTAFPIHISDADLSDLADRLDRVRWPDAGTTTDWRQGPALPTIRRLVERWRRAGQASCPNRWCS